MAKDHLISVIIPTYDSGSFIRLAVESVLSQTYQFFEIIIIDDGSTDNTEKILKSMADPRIRYIKTSNKGNYFARNRGLEEARGDFIAFLDADDAFMPKKLSKQLDKFIENPDLGFCCTNFYIQFANQENKTFANTSYSFEKDFSAQNIFIDRILDVNFIMTSSIMIRRECFMRLGVFDTKFQNAMDYEFCLRVIFNYPAYYIAEKLIQRFEHGSNISKNKINSHRALSYIFKECVPKFKTGKFYKPYHEKLIQIKWQRDMYYLGLEHLSMGSFKEAHQCLKASRYSRKFLFKIFAMGVAYFQSKFLASLIDFYRQKKQRGYLYEVKEH